MEDTLQSILYGQLEVEIKQPSLHDQYEIVRAVVANPSALPRLKVQGELHPWVALLLKTLKEQTQSNDRPPPS
jgi:hypothetical protein